MGFDGTGGVILAFSGFDSGVSVGGSGGGWFT